MVVNREMWELGLYQAQRVSALAMVPFVLVHLVVIFLAVRYGLSAGDIIARVQANAWGWGIFYTGFVVAAAIHAAIGLRIMARQWLGWRGISLDIVSIWLMVVLVGLGARAVIGVIG